MTERKHIFQLAAFVCGGFLGWYMAGAVLFWSQSSMKGVAGDPNRGLRALAFGRVCVPYNDRCYVGFRRVVFGPVEYLGVKRVEKGKDMEWEGSLEWRGEGGPVAEEEREGMLRILERWTRSIDPIRSEWDEYLRQEKRIYGELRRTLAERKAKIWAERRQGIRIIYCKAEIREKDGNTGEWILAYIRQ